MENTPLLQELHVVDLASFIAGPAAATVLGDFGADVVKVEPPHTGDAYRSLDRIPPNPHVEGINYPWQLDNRNKRTHRPRARGWAWSTTLWPPSIPG
ncbi:CoA transferase [Streptomyces sp. PA03-5A]|nr:CoA transferase [Streptomyces sp. PA03-5A]